MVVVTPINVGALMVVVTPANAGVHIGVQLLFVLDTRVRGYDDNMYLRV